MIKELTQSVAWSVINGSREADAESISVRIPEDVP
jgi:hypothetical protein